MTTFAKWYEWIEISTWINSRTWEVFGSLGDHAANLDLGPAGWYWEAGEICLSN